MISHAAKARIRLAAVTLALVPIALLARACYSEKMTGVVAQRWWRAWQRHDEDAAEKR